MKQCVNISVSLLFPYTKYFAFPPPQCFLPFLSGALKNSEKDKKNQKLSCQETKPYINSTEVELQLKNAAKNVTLFLKPYFYIYLCTLVIIFSIVELWNVFFQHIAVKRSIIFCAQWEDSCWMLPFVRSSLQPLIIRDWEARWAWGKERVGRCQNCLSCLSDIRGTSPPLDGQDGV